MVWVKKKATGEKISDQAAQLLLDNGYKEVFILAKKDKATIKSGADDAYLWYCKGTSYSCVQLAKFALVSGIKWMTLKMQVFALSKLTTDVLKLLNDGITVEQIDRATRELNDDEDHADLWSDGVPDKMN